MKTNFSNLLPELRRRAAPFQNVLGFTFSHWRRRPLLATWIGTCVLFSTLADVLVPLYAGRLIDALAESDRDAALTTALEALGVMIVLGALLVLFRHLGFLGVVRMTLGMPTPSLARRCARSPAASGRSTC